MKEVLDELNTRVTAAIMRAEALPAGSAETKQAFREVAAIEEEIAALLGGDTVEGAVARLGAVQANMSAGDLERAVQLAKIYLAEELRARSRDRLAQFGDWHPSCANPKRQLLNVEVPAKYGCDPNKPPPPGCENNSCYWRGGYRSINGKDVHIEVPELSMFADTLTRSITACRDPYAIKRISACAAWRRPPASSESAASSEGDLLCERFFYGRTLVKVVNDHTYSKILFARTD